MRLVTHTGKVAAGRMEAKCERRSISSGKKITSAGDRDGGCVVTGESCVRVSTDGHVSWARLKMQTQRWCLVL